MEAIIESFQYPHLMAIVMLPAMWILALVAVILMRNASREVRFVTNKRAMANLAVRVVIVALNGGLLSALAASLAHPGLNGRVGLTGLTLTLAIVFTDCGLTIRRDIRNQAISKRELRIASKYMNIVFLYGFCFLAYLGFDLWTGLSAASIVDLLVSLSPPLMIVLIQISVWHRLRIRLAESGDRSITHGEEIA